MRVVKAERVPVKRLAPIRHQGVGRAVEGQAVFPSFVIHVADNLRVGVGPLKEQAVGNVTVQRNLQRIVVRINRNIAMILRLDDVFLGSFCSIVILFSKLCNCRKHNINLNS